MTVSPNMCASAIDRIPTDDRLFHRQPEYGVVNAISLQGPQQHHGAFGVAIQQEETKVEYFRLPGCFGHILPSKDSRPILDLVVIFAVDTLQDVRGGIEFGRGERIQNRICRKEMIRVMMRDKDGFKGIFGGFFDPAYDG